MTLATHAVAGGFIGAIAAQNPILAGSAAFLSHFLLDAIPHWDYKLRSSKEDSNQPMNNNISINRDFVIDLFKIGFDMLLGFSIILGLFYNAPLYVIISAFIGGCLAVSPDFLQFVYFKFRREPLVSLQKFHVIFMHAKTNLNNQPLIGVSAQLVLIFFIIVLVQKIGL